MTAANERRKEAELQRLSGEEGQPSSWQRLCPQDAWQDPLLRRIAALLDRPASRALLERYEAEAAYPAELVAQLKELGLAELLVGSGQDHQRVTAYHLCALNALCARRDASLAITVGVNILALLSAYVSASPKQLAAIGDRVRAGAFCCMLLTELDHGSNLLRNQAAAHPGRLDGRGRFVPGDQEPTHYRLTGEKDYINGGIHHDLLFVFLRTRNHGVYDATSAVNPLRARSDFTFFWLDRQDGVEGLSRWRTLPARAADISGVRFKDVVIPADQVLGGHHGGFKVAQKTLILSRGGIAALASGCLSRARELATTYAARRNVYGTPIHHLGAIAEHLLHLAALDLATAAISLKATACLNEMGLSAAHYTSTAKLTGCAFAERGVSEGRKVLGSRALVEDLPYARLIRDITLYGVFDGTHHVMLEEIASRLGQQARKQAQDPGGGGDPVARMSAIYQAPARPFPETLQEHRRAEVLRLDRLLDGVAGLAAGDAEPVTALAGLTRALYGVVSSLRTTGSWEEQALRFAGGRCYARLEALAALVELATPAVRAGLGIPGRLDERDVAVAGFAVRWLGGQVVDDIRALAWQGAVSLPEGLDRLEAQLRGGVARARREALEVLVPSG